MKQITFVLFLLLVAQAVFSQTVYISTADNNIFKINEDNTVEFVVSVVGIDMEKSIFDIAISPGNQFYGIVDNSVIEIDIQDGSFTEVTQFPNFGGNNAYTSLVCSADNDIYTINNTSLQLYKYDITNDRNELVADINSMTPGDLSIYKGHLIFPDFPYIKAYSLANNTLTNIHCIPSVNGLIWGMATQFEDCDNSRVLGSTATGEIWEFVIDSMVTNVLPISPGLFIYGLASDNEYLATDCDFVFEAVLCGEDTVRTSVSPIQLQSSDLAVYPNPAAEILYIKSTQVIKQLVIYDVSGKEIASKENIGEQIDISALEDGMYLFRLFTDEGNYLKKIVKGSQ